MTPSRYYVDATGLHTNDGGAVIRVALADLDKPEVIATLDIPQVRYLAERIDYDTGRLDDAGRRWIWKALGKPGEPPTHLGLMMAEEDLRVVDLYEQPTAGRA